MVIIGLGEAGKNICSKMPKNGNIRTIVLDAGKSLPECSTHEEYEERVPKLANKLRLGKQQDIWLITAGAGKVSGAGGGGFMFFYVPIDKRKSVIESLAQFNGEVSNTHFTNVGVKSWKLD